MEHIIQHIQDYGAWIHFITAVLLLIFIVYWIWKCCVNSITFTADNSKYAYLIIKWILAHKKQEMTPEMEKKFINVQDMQAIMNMQNFINTVKAASLRDCKYNELKHPFFIWNDKVFVRTTGNDVVMIESGRLGKISMEENVKEITISGSFTRVMAAIEYALKMEQHFKGLENVGQHNENNN
jgi:hypothetical protein